MLASSSEKDIVFDPFLGSGTTSVVAKKLNRHYIGIEIEAQYCVWAEQRLEMAENNPDIQGYVHGVFWERNSLPEQNAIQSGTKDIKSKRGRKHKTEEPITIIKSETTQETMFDF